ncbi:MAG: hypothetical protein ACTHOP_00875 [Mesorhizobium sp.]
MRVLVVEDEEHKSNDLIAQLNKNGVDIQTITLANSVREAVLAVTQDAYDLIVLDMALPTFSKGAETDQVGGLAQSSGGIEVLRTLQASGVQAKIIIVTQYPEIIINGASAKQTQVAGIVSRRYGQIVLGTVIYSFNTPEWGRNFDRIIGGIKWRS